ncbi:hypothetical protein DY000_02006143 [Brassica cretica]|uniref:Uncharacterized protein n=1 Tax=Brassica cretica TaxID=69181 RepID=A0ABQ7C6T2_BRACR|nr:hypothetical protein DY000_02006143 [Brassica cretica]
MLAHVLDDYPKGLDPDFDVLSIEKPFDYFFRRFDVVSLVVLNEQDKHDQFPRRASTGERLRTCVRGTWNRHRLTVQCTGPSRMRPERSFGWNHGRMTDVTVLDLAFPVQLHILRHMVELESTLDELDETTAAYGFPLALQLFAFEAVPLLLAKIPNAQSTDNFLVNPPACENTVTILSVNDIVEVEEDPYVSLRLTVQLMPTPEAERYMWLDEVADQRVMHLVDLMLSGHRFQKSDFPGGDTLFAPVVDDKENVGKGVRKVAQRNDQPVHCRNLRPRKPAAVIIEGISSSEDREPEARPQADRCTHEDLKPWIEQQFKQLASAVQK